MAGLCELSCSVAYGRVRFCSAKMLLLNFSSPHFLVQYFISGISLKSQGLSLKRIAPDHDRDKSLESLVSSKYCFVNLWPFPVRSVL